MQTVECYQNHRVIRENGIHRRPVGDHYQTAPRLMGIHETIKLLYDQTYAKQNKGSCSQIVHNNYF